MKQAMRKPDESTEVERSFELERIVFFSDAVFAIAVTLLAIELHVPELSVESSDALVSALLAEVPKFFAFGMSFWIIALFWVAHHRYFRYIIKYDAGLLMLNLLLLFCVSLVPFTMSVLGEYGNLRAANWLYAANMVALGLSSAWFWHHATSNNLLVPDVSPSIQRYILLRSLATPFVAVIVFLLTIFIEGYTSNGFFLIFVVQRLITFRYRNQI